VARGPLFEEGGTIGGAEALDGDGALEVGSTKSEVRSGEDAAIPAGYVQVHVMADRWRVTEQTIRNYIRGAYNVPKMPAVLDSRGWAWLDPTECDRWKAANRPGHVGRGGARVGAGKKRRAMARRMGRVPVGNGTLAAELARVEEERATEPVSLPSARRLGGGAGGGAPAAADGSDYAVNQPRFEDLHPTAQESIRLNEAKRKQIEFALEEKRGEYLKKTDVVAAVRSAFESARERLERRAARLAPVLMARLGLDPGARAIIEGVLGADDSETIEELSGGMGELGTGNGGAAELAAGNAGSAETGSEEEA